MKIKTKILAILSAVALAVTPTISTTVYGAGGGSASVVNIEKTFEEKHSYTPDYTKVVFEVRAKSDIVLTKETEFVYGEGEVETGRYINPIYTFDPDTEGRIPRTTDKGEYKAGEVIGTFSMTQPDPNGEYDFMKKSVTSLVTASSGHTENYELTLEEISTDPEYEVEGTRHTLTVVPATAGNDIVYVDGEKNYFPMPVAIAGGTYVIRQDNKPNNLVVENKLKGSQTPEEDKKPETGKDEQKPNTDKKEEVKKPTTDEKPKGEANGVQKARTENKPSYPETGVETLNPLIGIAGFVVLVLGGGYFYKKFKQK